MRLNSETNNFKSNRILGLEYSFLKKEKLEPKMVRVIQKREIKEYESTPNFKRIKYIEITDDYNDYSDQQDTEDSYDLNDTLVVLNQEKENMPLVSERIIGQGKSNI